MKKLFALAAFALMAASFGIGMDQYLYSGENLTKKSFALDGANYMLYFINGTESFLVNADDDALITDRGKIGSVIKDYYVTAYMLSQNETDGILALMDAINASRNDGRIGAAGRPGMEEYACRELMAVGISNLINNSNPDYNLQLIAENLDRMSIYISNDWIQGGTYGDATEMRKELDKFFNASFKLDKELISARSAISSMDENNAYQSLESAKQSIDRMYPYRTTLESTSLRMPATYTECPDCLGICYFIDINKTAMDLAKSKIAAAQNRTKGLANTTLLAEKVANRTDERIEFAKNKDLAAYYTIKMRSLTNYWNTEFAAINKTMSVIDDPALSAKVQAIRGNISSINSSISSLSLDGLDGKLNSTMALINATRELATQDMLLFDALLNASALADKAAMMSDDNETAAEKARLDALMTIPVNYNTALMLTVNYTDLASKSTKNFTAADLGLSDQGSLITARMINGFYTPLNLLQRNAIKPYDDYAVLSAPALIAISLSSLIAIFTLGSCGLARKGYNKGSVVLMSIIPGAILITMIMTLSAAMYLFTPGVESSTGPLMFMDYTNGDPVYIVVNTADLNSSMMDCAKEIDKALDGNGAQASIATYDGSICTLNGEEYGTNCVNKISDGIIYLTSGNYSITSKVFLVPTLEVRGNDLDFQKCAIARLYGLEE